MVVQLTMVILDFSLNGCGTHGTLFQRADLSQAIYYGGPNFEEQSLPRKEGWSIWLGSTGTPHLERTGRQATKARVSGLACSGGGVKIDGVAATIGEHDNYLLRPDAPSSPPRPPLLGLVYS